MRYSREDGCRVWLAYGDFQPRAISALLREHGSGEAVYDHLRCCGRGFLEPYLGPAQIDVLCRRAEPQAMHEMMLAMQQWDMGILTPQSECYPDMLRNIQDPPGLLFYRGHPEALADRTITIVGSRKSSKAGVEATREIARELSAHGVHIVSGMAMGIDSAAMQGGLDGGTPVIGVLGCGLDVDYPVGNSALKRRVIESGGVLISEYPPGSPALPWHFPIRNRIMSGLSKAVLMMEGRIRSGSMTTVQHALDQGREVFAYPGEARTPWSEGANQLLREGANYFTTALDVLEDLGWLSEAPLTAHLSESKPLPPMTPDQRRVYELLQTGAMSFDELAVATGMDAPNLSGTLTMLQIMGLVEPLPGKAYKTA